MIFYYFMLGILVLFALYGFYWFLMKPKFIFEIDDSDPEDVKFKLICFEMDDVKPGRRYFVRTVRKDKDSRDN